MTTNVKRVTTEITAMPTVTEVINFYTTKGPGGFMTNFYRAPIEIFGRMWMTSEHAYQAQKFVGQNQEDYDAVHNAINPMAAAIIGRDTNRPCRSDWDQVKDDVMRFVVMHKFLQNKDIQEKLLLTGDAKLVEHDTRRHDMYWGDGGDGSGKNMLGVVLMEVREIIREEIRFYEANPETKSSGPVAAYLACLRFGDE